MFVFSLEKNFRHESRSKRANRRWVSWDLTRVFLKFLFPDFSKPSPKPLDVVDHPWSLRSWARVKHCEEQEGHCTSGVSPTNGFVNKVNLLHHPVPWPHFVLTEWQFLQICTVCASELCNFSDLNRQTRKTLYYGGEKVNYCLFALALPLSWSSRPGQLTLANTKSPGSWLLDNLLEGATEILFFVSF